MDPVSMAAVGGAYALNNFVSEVHASNQAARDAKLMHEQNALNRSNVLGAYVDKVTGMKMAGLNPALAADGTPAVATASKASAGMAENVEFDPASLLLKAQADNLAAQTDKTKAETKKIEGVDTSNVEADTQAKLQSVAKMAKDMQKTDADIKKLGAETALVGMQVKTEGFKPNLLWAQAESEYKKAGLTDSEINKIKAETARVWQLNSQYKDQNEAYSKLGPKIAEDVINSANFEVLDDASKQFWQNVKDGKVKLTVGAMLAVNDLYNTNTNITAKDRENNEATLGKIVTKRQLFDEDTVKALGNLPKHQAKAVELGLNELANRIENISKDTALKTEEAKLKAVEKAAKEFQLKILKISPEGNAAQGQDWNYIKSVARSYVEDPSKLIIPFAAARTAKGFVESRSGSQSSQSKPQFQFRGPIPGASVPNKSDYRDLFSPTDMFKRKSRH